MEHDNGLVGWTGAGRRFGSGSDGADQQRFQEPPGAWENKASDSDGFAGRTSPSPEYVRPL